jgi:hypothetical protein
VFRLLRTKSAPASLNITGAHRGRQVAGPMADSGGRRSLRRDGNDRVTPAENSRQVRDHAVQRQVVATSPDRRSCRRTSEGEGASLIRAVRLC